MKYSDSVSTGALALLVIASLVFSCQLRAQESAVADRMGDAIELTGNLQIASSYLYRGINLNDKLTPSLALSARHDNGLFASFWLGEDDIAGVLGESRDSDVETEYLLGYAYTFNRELSMSVARIWHEYLQDNQPRSHDFQETTLQLNHSRLGSFALGHGRDVWTSGMNLTYVYYQHRTAFFIRDQVFYSVQELGTNWLTRGRSEMQNTRLDYARLSIASPLGAGFVLQLDYSYSRSNRSNFFNSDRIGSQPVITLRRSF